MHALLHQSILLRVACVLALAVPVAAEDFDESKLPPPATVKVNFGRDIKPVLEQICWRCHSGERPKSHFRLTDRESALKGGSQGRDIIPGKSAGSPLVYYIARLVKDMDMPPKGKGPPLTTEQVGLFRAWIDQGAVWDEPGAAALYAPGYSFSPTLRWYGVSGNGSKFRELRGVSPGWDGGAEEFSFRQTSRGGRTVSVQGHALRDDYGLALDLRKEDLGFTRIGYEQFRKYYDDSGGYYAPFSPAISELGRDLHLDLTKAYAEVGLTLPNWPRLVLGYEYQAKEGDKSMLSWGPVQPPSGDSKNIYPSVENLDEHAHLLRLDASYERQGWALEDNARAEWSQVDTQRRDATFVVLGQPTPSQSALVQEGHSQFQFSDTFRMEKQVAHWLYLSGGYLYSSVDANDSFRMRTEDVEGQLAVGPAWASPDIILKASQHVLNLNSHVKPLEGLTATLGVQSEWRQQQGYGDASLDIVTDPNDPTRTLRFPALTESSLNDRSVEENLMLRYTQIPFTALFAEARLKQEDLARFDAQTGDLFPFERDSDATSNWQEYRGGFSVSPWRQVSWDVQYKHRIRDTDYDNRLRESPPGLAYPGFILRRAIETDELETKLVLRPAPWLKTTLAYHLVATDYHTTTDATDPQEVGSDATPGGTVLAGQYDAHIWSGNVTLTPHHRVYLSTTLAYQTSQTTTASHGDLAVAPYRGDNYSVLASLGFVLDEATDLALTYSWSQAGYAQHNADSGLPLGVDYDYHALLAGLTHRFAKNVTARLQYGFYRYTEPSSGHFTDFNAHMVFATVTLAWP